MCTHHFLLSLKLKNKMARAVSWTHVPTDSCSSNLSQIPLNVHQQALELKEKWETVGWSTYCNRVTLGMMTWPHIFWGQVPGSGLRIFLCNNLKSLTWVLESMHNHHLHFTDEVDLKGWEIEDPAQDHIMKGVSTISMATCTSLSKTESSLHFHQNHFALYDPLNPWANKKVLFSAHSPKGRPVLVHSLNLQIFAKTVWTLLKLFSSLEIG